MGCLRIYVPEEMRCKLLFEEPRTIVGGDGIGDVGGGEWLNLCFIRCDGTFIKNPDDFFLMCC